jgi:PAS domain-containing protein
MLLMVASWFMYFAEVEERHHTEGVFQQCLDAAEAGRWSWNLRTGELVWDERMFKIWGKDPAQFSGHYDYFASSLHPEDQERVAGLLEATISSHGAYRTQFRVYGDNGAVRRVRAAGGVTKDGKSMVGICLTALSPTEMPADFWAKMLLEHENQRVASSPLPE